MSTSTLPILTSLLEPVSASLNVEASRKLLELKADRKAQARVARLAAKCNDGTLTTDEKSEYESLIMAGEFVGILQAQARLILARESA